jgi:hypothetical protein
VRVRAQTEQLSGVVDGLRKKKNERKRERKKDAECFIRYATINLSLCWFFFTSRSNSSRGPLFVNIHMERTRLLA